MNKLKFDVVNYSEVKTMDYESLGKHLIKRRNDSEYIKDKIDYAADIIEEILWTYMVDGND